MAQNRYILQIVSSICCLLIFGPLRIVWTEIKAGKCNSRKKFSFCVRYTNRCIAIENAKSKCSEEHSLGKFSVSLFTVGQFLIAFVRFTSLEE